MDTELNVADVVWDLTPLYKGVDDPAIDTDIERLKGDVSAFSSDYRGRIEDISPNELAQLMLRLEEIGQRAAKLGTFAYLNYATQTGDASAGAFLQRIQEMGSALEKETLFFRLDWARLDDDTAERLLKSPEIEKYRHYLKLSRRYKPYQLKEVEERLLADISPVGISSWHRLFGAILSHMKFGEKGRSEEEVLADLYNPDREVRKSASEELTGGLKGHLHILTHIFNTILADHMISDRLRHYPAWISSRNLDNEIEDAAVETLVTAVEERHDIPRRYYRLKKKLLGYDELLDYDRYAPLPFTPDRLHRWEECREIVLSSFARFSPEMERIAAMFFDGKWLHAPVTAGKVGGAFAHPATPDVHPFILVNYTGNERDIQTVAHELGHGIHQFLAGRRQGFFNASTPLTTAETASVFGEMLVFHSLLDAAKGKEARLSLLCNKIEGILATVFRQISMNRFEECIHKERRDRGELSSERLSQLWMETQERMFGDSLTLTDNYRVWWSYIPHFIHSPGYVYAYAFGELLVLSLYRRYRDEGESFVEKYMELLSSGGKDSPATLLSSFGIDLNDPHFWQEGLTTIDEMVREAEEL
ncbi:MAG: M3 family oligoendopeptidase [Thermodesulfobacteriota bacterium]